MRCSGHNDRRYRHGLRHRSAFSKVAFHVLMAGSVLAIVLEAIFALAPISSDALTPPTGSLPSVSTPAVSTPSVTIPSISTPAVSTPAVTIPSVSTPAVSTPSVSTPSVSTHSLATPSGGSPAATSSPGSAGAAAPASDSPAATSSGSSGSGSPSSGSGAAAPGASQLAFLGRSSNTSEQAATGSAGAASTKYLRELVTQLSRCLSALAPQAQRVLVLRAGIGIAHSYTRNQVASMLHVSMAYEGRVQRAAVTALQTAAQHGTCGAAPGSIPVSALPLAQDELVTIVGPQPGAAKFLSAAKIFAASHSNLSARREARSPRSSRPAASGIPPQATPPILKAELSRSSAPVGAWTFGVLALLAVLAMLFVARRRFVHEQPTPAGTHPAPAAPAVPPAAPAVAPADAWLASQPAPEPTETPRQELPPLAPTSTAWGRNGAPRSLASRRLVPRGSLRAHRGLRRPGHR